ncbi:MAG: ABC transporter ATP-binding protein [Microthrixaceae bacterium]|nr:ABC transporter ATP-binding protein [Microthrixaceae bacterium]
MSIRGVTKRYAGATNAAVDSLDLDIAQGELVVFVGPSGCGKTTTLRMINRLEDPTAGSIHVNGTDVTEIDPAELRRSIGYVIQQGGLFPHQSVATNIGCVPRLLGWPKARIRERVEELIELVRLDPDLLDRYPSSLSGGQQQRVGVARALAADPPILLMDEPYSAVDPVVRAELRHELRSLQERLAKTIVFVTHDIDEAIDLGDRIAVFKTGGHLAQYSVPTELLARPDSQMVEDFLGADRTLRRLSLLTVTTAQLEPATATTPPLTIEASFSLRSTLDALLANATDLATVVDLDGSVLGVITLDAIAQIASGDPDSEPVRPWAAPRRKR